MEQEIVIGTHPFANGIDMYPRNDQNKMDVVLIRAFINSQISDVDSPRNKDLRDLDLALCVSPNIDGNATMEQIFTEDLNARQRTWISQIFRFKLV